MELSDTDKTGKSKKKKGKQYKNFLNCNVNNCATNCDFNLDTLRTYSYRWSKY